MIDGSELLFTVDSNNNPIDPMPRDQAHAEHIWHRVAHVFLVNTKREIMCHKRSSYKDQKPGRLDTCFGGHMDAGASPESSALRELLEEAGIEARPEELVPYILFRNAPVFEYQYVYVVVRDIPAESVIFEREEVDYVCWMSAREVGISMVDDPDRWARIGYTPELVKLIAAGEYSK